MFTRTVDETIESELVLSIYHERWEEKHKVVDDTAFPEHVRTSVRESKVLLASIKVSAKELRRKPAAEGARPGANRV